jgi:hypothetical protein
VQRAAAGRRGSPRCGAAPGIAEREEIAICRA